MDIALALFVGAAFGAALDRIGASNPNVITGMLALRDLRLMKAILLAIGVGASLTFGGQILGLVDVGHLSVKAATFGVLIGGAVLGAGWALAGYCPGTGLAAAASGRRDGVFFVLGGLVGAGLYMASHSWVAETGALTAFAGGKTTLGAVPGAPYGALMPWLPGDVAGLAMGLGFIALAFALPDRLIGSGAPAPAA